MVTGSAITVEVTLTEEKQELTNEVDRIRYRFGIVTNTQLDANKVSCLHNQNVISENQNTYKSSIKHIGKAIGNASEEFSIQLPLVNIKKEYELEIVAVN